MARYRFKEFNPKPFEPGARIEWDHSTLSGLPPVRRSGVVWSGAPTGNRAGRGLWVSPDDALPGDLYGLIYVYVPPQRKYDHRDLNTPRGSDDPGNPNGAITAYAARIAAATRRDNARDRAA